MAITLNVVKPTTETEKSLAAGYLYKDIGLDLKPEYTTNAQLFKTNEKRDLSSMYDVASVINSLKNILTTSPGEKLLNPEFGLDLRDFLFEGVSETSAFFLGKHIYDGLTTQEPRLSVDYIKVVALVDDNTYNIDIDISVPTLNAYNLSLKGVLNIDGYTFV